MIRVSQRSFDYLAQQRGDLARYLGNGGDHWIEAYNASVRKLFEQIQERAPFPRRVLDVGSGLGGIDVLLIRHFRSRVMMVDGEFGGPRARRHDEPFCSRSAVEAFMADNDVEQDDYEYCPPEEIADAGPFDLVMSLRSWCFHYSPEAYLEYVERNTRTGAIMILDVRVGKFQWSSSIRSKFDQIEHLERGAKCNRTLFRRR